MASSNPTVNLVSGTDRTFKTVQLASPLLTAPLPTGGRTGYRIATWPGAMGGSAIGAANQVYLLPFIVTLQISFTAGLIYVTAGGAGSAVKGAIWANSPISNRPVGNPLFADNVGVATTASSAEAIIALGNGTLAPGLYWTGVKAQATLPTVLCASGNGLLRSIVGAKTSMLCYSLAYADTYGNNMPLISEGATFTESNTAAPVMDLLSA